MTSASASPRWWATWGVLGGVLLGLASPSSHAATRFFFGVSASQGREGEATLKWAQSDVEKMETVFTELGGVHPSRSVVLHDPTVRDVEDALLKLQGNLEEVRRQGERAEVVLHYAGHGDETSLHLTDGNLDVSVFQAAVARLPAAATVVVLDACRTSSSTTRGATVGPRFEGSVVRTPAPDGVVLMFASKTGEIAQESDAIEGAFFTHALLAGLRGAADVDHDGQVTLAEAWQVAHAQTLTKTHASAAAQHPQLQLQLEGEGDLVLTQLARARAVVRLQRDIQGHVLLLDARTGRVIVEVEKHDAAVVDLAVPATKVGVQVRPTSGAARRGELSLEWGGTTTVGWDDLDDAPMLATVARGAGDVDATPWEASAALGASFSPQALPGGVVRVAGQRRLWQWPLFLGVAVDAAGGQQEQQVWTFQHGMVRALVTTRAQGHVGPVRLAGGLDVGLVAVGQHAFRKDGARIGAVLTPPAELWTGALGPVAGVRGQAGVALVGGWFALLELGASGQLLPVVVEHEAQWQPQARADVLVGVGGEF